MPIGTGGMVTLYNSFGRADVIVDVNGFFTDGSMGGGVYTAVAPARIMDTRSGVGGFHGKVGPGQTVFLAVDGKGGVPLSTSPRPPTAVILNVTVTGGTAASYVTLAPAFTTMPNASDLNFAAGQTIANLAVVAVGSGVVQIRNAAGSVYVIVDVEGWYS